MNKNKLRGLIHSKHKTRKEFSDAIGWQEKKTSRIVNGEQEPTMEDAKMVTRHFELSQKEFLELFFEGLFSED